MMEIQQRTKRKIVGRILISFFPDRESPLSDRPSIEFSQTIMSELCS